MIEQTGTARQVRGTEVAQGGDITAVSHVYRFH